MVNKIRWLANIFLLIGIVFGLIVFFQIPSLDVLNFSMDWIFFLFDAFIAILLLILGISLKCINHQLNDEIQSIYRYYDQKIKDIENSKQPHPQRQEESL